MMPALQLFGAGREAHLCGAAVYHRGKSRFRRSPTTVQQWDRHAPSAGSTHSYLDEVVLDDAGNRMFVCSNTDY
ncbi:alpha-D-ribose 1-methylphosphonate 5-phosphate C-P-lyase PhnJ [Escherichia coli]